MWLAAPLASATARGDGVLSNKLLQAGAIVKGPALHKAVQAGHTAIVDVLLEHGASIEEEADEDDYGTPLHVAAEAGQMEIARLLLTKGADVNYVGLDHNTPLTHALQSGNLAMAEMFVKNDGADLALRVTEWDLSALDFATSGDAVRLLVKHGAEVNDASSSGHTALHTAAQSNNMDAIHALVEAGADLEAADMIDHRPLHYAAGFSYTQTISPQAALALLDLGAEINAQSGDGQTALHAAARAGEPGSAEMVDLLLRRGADETILSRQGKTAWELVNARRCSIHVNVPGDDERVLALLARAPADRAWRRRGMVVLCRALPDRVRLNGDLASLAARMLGLVEVGVFRKIVLYL